jgi:hypothetical protein
MATPPTYFEANPRTTDKATGVHTRQFVVKAPAAQDPNLAYLVIHHGLKKNGSPVQPDWVRVVPIAQEVPRSSPVPNNGVCQPVGNGPAMDIVPKKLHWAGTVDGGVTSIDTKEDLYFMVSPSFLMEGEIPAPVYFDTFWEVEIGYTHSTPT